MSMIKNYYMDIAPAAIDNYRRQDITKLSDKEKNDLCGYLAFITGYDAYYLNDILNDMIDNVDFDGVTEMNSFIDIALENDF